VIKTYASGQGTIKAIGHFKRKTQVNSVMKLQKVTKKPDKNAEKGILINAHIYPLKKS
jgi:hypothetical protein